DQLADVQAMVGELVGDQPGSWDTAREIPAGLLHKLGAAGVLCAQVPAAFGGLGATSQDNGELTAYVVAEPLDRPRGHALRGHDAPQVTAPAAHVGGQLAVV